MTGAKKRSDSLDIDSVVKELKGICAPQLDEVAKNLRVSSRSLQRCLASHNISFTELLDSVRSARAKQLLRDTDLSISEVAQEMGQGDVSNFGRSFQRWTGDTPGKWRKAARKER